MCKYEVWHDPSCGFHKAKRVEEKSVSPRADGNSFLGNVIVNLLLKTGGVLTGSVGKVPSLGTRYQKWGLYNF